MATLTRPENPGTYIHLVGESAVRPPANVAASVAIPIVHDWGPLGKEEGVKEVEVFASFDSQFGNTATEGRNAVLGACVGPGVPGQPGAGTVYVYRMAASSVKAAKLEIKNTAAAAAIILTAFYKGTRGNRISVVIDADPVTPANARLTIRLDGAVQERYSFVKTDITGLATAVNSRSKLVKAEMKATGVALATTAGSSLTEGNDGASLSATEWEEALAALEKEDISIFAPFNLVTPEIVAMVYTWTLTQAENQTPVTTVLGGAGSENLSEAITKAESVRSEHVIRLAGGEFFDSFIDQKVTTSQLAPRIAGILAGRGEESSLTFASVAGLQQVGSVAIATDELAAAAAQGLTVFRRASRADAELMIAKGVTTFIEQTNPDKPYELFSDPRIVRVGDLFLRRMKEWGDENIVGPTRVIETTMAAVNQKGLAEISDLLTRGMILPGTNTADKPFFRIVEDAGPNFEDAIVFEFGFKFARTTNFLIGTGKVR
jgi:hypothetical protein